MKKKKKIEPVFINGKKVPEMDDNRELNWFEKFIAWLLASAAALFGLGGSMPL